MNFSYISHKKTMSITSFAYRSNLYFVYKESLSRITAFLGVSASKSCEQAFHDWGDHSYVKLNLVEALEKLCLKELELVRKFVKAGYDVSMVKMFCWAYDIQKMYLLVSVCHDKNTRKGNLLMTDELRDLFALHLDSVLKNVRKKEKELVAEPDMLVIDSLKSRKRWIWHSWVDQPYLQWVW